MAICERIRALRSERRGCLAGQPFGGRLQLDQGVSFERQLRRLFAHRCLIGEPHTVRRQNTSERVDEDRLHAEFVGDEAGVLATGAAEALQGEARDVVPLLHRDLLDRIRHVGDGDMEKPLGDRSRITSLAGGVRDPIRERDELRSHRLRIQGLIAARPENRGKVSRLNLPDADIGVRDRERTAPAIAGGAGIGAGAVRPDPQPRAVEMQDRAAAGRHRVDRHHRRAHPNAGDFGFKGALERPGIERHVGRGAAHVEADDSVEPGHRGGSRRADDAPGRTGQNGVLALKTAGLGQSAVRLHEVEANALQFGGDLIHVAAQDR